MLRRAKARRSMLRRYEGKAQHAAACCAATKARRSMLQHAAPLRRQGAACCAATKTRRSMLRRYEGKALSRYERGAAPSEELADVVGGLVEGQATAEGGDGGLGAGLELVGAEAVEEVAGEDTAV